MPFFRLFSGPESPLTSTKYAQSYEDEFTESLDLDDEGEGRWLKFFPREQLKTNLLSVVFAALSHYLYGIFFNAYEAVNARYDYPNLGSMCFVLATALVLVRFDLSLKSLPIESRTWKYSVYKILAVIFLTHLVLAGIWQQMVNLTWELFFLGKDGVEVLASQTQSGLLRELGAQMNLRTAKWVMHGEGMAVLTAVLYSSAD